MITRRAQTQAALKKLVESPQPTGILAYAGGEPVGWCAIAPRDAYPRLDRSRVLARVDDHPVWSVTCFFVAQPLRASGVSVQLLRAAVAHAAKRGVKIIEGYPVEPRKDSMPDVFAWTGFASAFRRAGSREAARRAATRPIMRFVIRPPRSAGGLGPASPRKQLAKQ